MILSCLQNSFIYDLFERFLHFEQLFIVKSDLDGPKQFILQSGLRTHGIAVIQTKVQSAWRPIIV